MENKKVVLITGASSGIGKATAEKFIKAGHIVYGVARRTELLKSLNEAGGHSFFMDVRDDKSVKDGVARVMDEQGKIDILVNNAGYAQYGSLMDVSIDLAKEQFETNVYGYVRTIKEVLKGMTERKSGTIINVTSTAGKINPPLITWYGASKFALEGLLDAFRVEVDHLGIKVVMIEPGFIDTQLYDVAKEYLDKVQTSKPYKNLKEKMWNQVKERQVKAPGPEIIANVIYEAGISDNPKTRYALPKDAKFFLFMRRILSDKRFDELIRKEMGLK